jgi:hypothetical protein
LAKELPYTTEEIQVEQVAKQCVDMLFTEYLKISFWPNFSIAKSVFGIDIALKPPSS